MAQFKLILWIICLGKKLLNYLVVVVVLQLTSLHKLESQPLPLIMSWEAFEDIFMFYILQNAKKTSIVLNLSISPTNMIWYIFPSFFKTYASIVMAIMGQGLWECINNTAAFVFIFITFFVKGKKYLTRMKMKNMFRETNWCSKFGN